MWGVNKVVLIGHLGKDPEIKHLANGVSVTSFPLATSEITTVSGRKNETTEWHNIVMWRNIAELAAKELTKGRLIYLEGKLRTRTYKDTNGNQRSVTEILAESYTVLGRAGSASSPEDFSSSKADNQINKTS